MNAIVGLNNDNSWTPQGLVRVPLTMLLLVIMVPVVCSNNLLLLIAQTGNGSTVSADGGTADQIADPSFVGIAGVTDVDQWNLIIFDGTNPAMGAS